MNIRTNIALHLPKISALVDALFAHQPDHLELEIDLGFCTLRIEHEAVDGEDSELSEGVPEDAAITTITLRYPGTYEASLRPVMMEAAFVSVDEFKEWLEAEMPGT